MGTNCLYLNLRWLYKLNDGEIRDGKSSVKNFFATK